MTLFKITFFFLVAALIILVVMLTQCRADCYYGCSDDNPPDDGIAYWMSRDGDYIPIPSPPPAVVYGPPVYYRNGYPIPVDPYPPDNYYRGHHRRGLSDDAIRQHERAVQQYHQRPRW